ncbi:dUTP diphosphatase [Virgibacillus halodenitrificans]|uniref:dUTP diphosphatase n=1 Tax=Virgibacillus halodenitrificans TaxID=1482 RepID=UPI000EF546D4|nr:dUTP diphosphatase [Virgibacillus halodenitrificans]
MNLQKLFQIQKQLDDRIVKEHGLEGQDLLDKKILALQVELGELANEQRSWKFWSHDQRTKGQDNYLEYRPVDQGGNHWVNRNPLLEEYVDCLHFILSVGLELQIPDEWVVNNIAKELTEKEMDIERQFIAFNQYLKINIDPHDWFDILGLFIGLGEMLGFTWEQIEQAYLDKNKINHERQANGY